MKLPSPTRTALLAAVLASVGSALARGACPPGNPGSPSPSGAEPTAVVHGLNPADMNPSAGACKDFNEYANGGWLKANPIPADQSYWGSFSILEETNRASLRKVAEKAAAGKDSAPGATDTDERKVGDFWAACMA